MKSFSYTVQAAMGIHARPAGLLARLAKEFDGTTITITKGEKSVKADQILMLMSLAVKQGDTITVTAEGADENTALERLSIFFRENL